MIMAFNSGGKPVYVMPLVFGGAPVVNTLAKSGFENIGGLFLAGLILVILSTALYSVNPWLLSIGIDAMTKGAAQRTVWLVALAGSMLVTTNQFGALFQQNTVRGGFGPYRFTLTHADAERHSRLYRLIAEVPPNATIVSSENIVPHVSYRANSYTLRTGMFDAESR